MNDSMLVVTTNDVPGYEIVKVYGEVFGAIAAAWLWFILHAHR
ncbi:MAG TPA: heavy metal-binding domain-containing protein [Candidatus Paceibacterota bacterium]|nr:heavy metal-binding domain-containing protein [Candidatus Paceibacterota bacterium]